MSAGKQIAILTAVIVGVIAATSVFGGSQDEAAPLAALARMPVKEVTVFKDGHAFVVHEGKMPVDAAGNVVMDYLPTPILGTFWPYSNEKNGKLSAVVASQRRVLIERTALTMRELLQANIGAAGTFTEVVPAKEAMVTYGGAIVAIPQRSGKELEATSPPNSGQLLPQLGSVVLIKLDAGGTKAVEISNVRDVIFKDAPKVAAGSEELRNLLTLKLEWADNKPAKQADVGLMYVQLGLRWIPSYKVVIDGKGGAVVKLEGTLVNELCDLDDVAANLVIGVPTFAMKDMVDPMSMQHAMAQLSQYFDQGQSRGRYALSNGLMTQQALASNASASFDNRMGGAGGEGAPMVDLGPEVGGGGRNEDLFVFPVKHVTLKKGQRMVLTVGEFPLKYKDVYKLDVPVAPPREVWQQFDNSRQAELARAFSAPKVMHNLRLTNSTKTPLTTAPVLIVRDGTVLAQGMITYTAPGADVDLPITAAVDVSVKKSDKEAKRTPNAANWNGVTYSRVDLTGTISLTNRREHAVDIEVTRFVAGNLTEAGQDGKIEMINGLEDAEALAPTGGSDYHPYWWAWYNWPDWWRHFNGTGKIRWTLTLDPGKAVDLTYSWNYLWR